MVNRFECHNSWQVVSKPSALGEGCAAGSLNVWTGCLKWATASNVDKVETGVGLSWTRTRWEARLEVDKGGPTKEAE